MSSHTFDQLCQISLPRKLAETKHYHLTCYMFLAAGKKKHFTSQITRFCCKHTVITDIVDFAKCLMHEMSCLLSGFAVQSFRKVQAKSEPDAPSCKNSTCTRTYTRFVHAIFAYMYFSPISTNFFNDCKNNRTERNKCMDCLVGANIKSMKSLMKMCNVPHLTVIRSHAHPVRPLTCQHVTNEKEQESNTDVLVGHGSE